jgi:hypothetical protein
MEIITPLLLSFHIYFYAVLGEGQTETGSNTKTVIAVVGIKLDE